jgi:hypothetical protein
MRRVMWLVLPLLVAAGCPVDPDATWDYDRRPDPSDVAAETQCFLESVQGSEVFYAARCSPVLHPQDLDHGNWESFGMTEFDVETVTVLGGVFYRLYYSAGGPDVDQAIGLATADDGVSLRRHLHNPVIEPLSGMDRAELLCTALDRLTPTYHGWFRVDDGSLRHATSEDGLAWTVDNAGPVSGLLSAQSDGLQQIWSCDAWHDGTGLRMLVGGRFGDAGDPVYAIGESVSDDGINFEPVDEPVLVANSASPWQGGGVGFPSRIEWGGTEYLFHIGGSAWDGTDPLAISVDSPRIGVAARAEEGPFTLHMANALPLPFEDAAPMRVRATVAGEWAMLYVRDEYVGVTNIAQDAVGAMAAYLPDLEEGS